MPDEALRRDVQALVDDAVRKCEFARDWRNRHLAHNDLALKLKRAARPLASARRVDVKEALAAFARVLNQLELAYFKSETGFSYIPLAGDGEALIAYLKLGLEAEQERRHRWKTHLNASREELPVTQHK